mmetsp:Transcript_107696/g.347624  ORF Transcript_107696/g.347624 Transcript_107696/m.347624 type:complete len:206 (+) Transcript_107696:993-1610(+)
MDAALPTPTRRRHGSINASDGLKPVSTVPAAVRAVPVYMSGLRPRVSARRPSGMLRANRAMEGAAMMRPTPVAPRCPPISAASSGITGITCVKPRFSISWEPVRMATCLSSEASMPHSSLLGPLSPSSLAFRSSALVDASGRATGAAGQRCPLTPPGSDTVRRQRPLKASAPRRRGARPQLARAAARPALGAHCHMARCLGLDDA